jgi:hypothetical protein
LPRIVRTPSRFAAPSVWGSAGRIGELEASIGNTGDEFEMLINPISRSLSKNIATFEHSDPIATVFQAFGMK